jgi:hypothetical protein
MEPIKIFVLGKHAETLERVLIFLQENGYEADGEVESEKSLETFRLKTYDIAIIGGGVDNKTRALVKTEFPKTSPEVEFVEHYGDPTHLFGEIEGAFKE